MSMSSYSLIPRDKLLHDYGDTPDGQAVDALVASGDCFITIATQLDDLTHRAAATNADNAMLEEIIRTLIYLQRHYGIVKKPANYRQ